jgi:siroheme synthase (precorrin-2 oxidase/ferrochelatase)
LPTAHAAMGWLSVGSITSNDLYFDDLFKVETLSFEAIDTSDSIQFVHNSTTTDEEWSITFKFVQSDFEILVNLGWSGFDNSSFVVVTWVSCLGIKISVTTNIGHTGYSFGVKEAIITIG